MTINWSIDIGNIFTLLGGLVVAVKVFIALRDHQMDIANIVKDHGRQLDKHDERLDNTEARLEKHHEWLLSKGINK